MQLFVGTPNLESRMIQFQKKLEEVPEMKKVKKAAVQTYRKFLESEWSNDAMYMNYLEGMVGLAFDDFCPVRFPSLTCIDASPLL